MQPYLTPNFCRRLATDAAGASSPTASIALSGLVASIGLSYRPAES
jgi:hypothetical protein